MHDSLRRVDDACACATLGRAFILVWRGEPTQHRMEVAREMLRQHATAMGGPVYLLSVVEEGSPPPRPEVMLLLEQWLEEVPRILAASVGVFETTGAALALHQAAEAVTAKMASSIPAKACFDVEEACSWLAARMATGKVPGPSRLALEAVIRAVREHLPTRVAAAPSSTL